MKVLILNSGTGSRMGDITKTHPKCMTDISETETIISRQLRIIAEEGITDVVITTGYYDKVLVDYCESLNLPLNFKFIRNDLFAETNYIYSIYCAESALQDDIIMIHGDMVFEPEAFKMVLRSKNSCMAVSSTTPLPEKDFKAVVNGEYIDKIGIEFFDSAVAAQPLYKILWKDWSVWLAKIKEFCEGNNRKCYAEKAFNEVSDKCRIAVCDVEDLLCNEVDTPQDLEVVSTKLKNKVEAGLCR